LLSSGAYINYNRDKEQSTASVDKSYIIGGNLNYQFTRKWHSLFDIKYRTRESTVETRNYNEFTVFASLIYGFGDVLRPTRIGEY
jgi:hypothetical protein